MKLMENNEIHKDKISYYIKEMTQKLIALDLADEMLIPEQIVMILGEINALNLSLKSHLTAEKRTIADLGQHAQKEYASVMETKGRLERVLRKVAPEMEFSKAA